MIPYNGGIFGFSILFRVHGSAIFKSLTPAFISAVIYAVLFFTVPIDIWQEPLFTHPYPMTALVTAFTFLLVFRANYSYNRWWEAYSTVYHMHSKWLDFATEVAAFHYQSPRYSKMKPPSFGSNAKIESFLLKDSDLTRNTDSSTKTLSKKTQHTLQSQPQSTDNTTPMGVLMPLPTTRLSSATTTIPEDRHVDNFDDATESNAAASNPTSAPIRQITRQRTMRHHNRTQTVEDIMQQLDAHEKAEKERQEQMDELQRHEEERIRAEIELQEQQQQEKASGNANVDMDGTANTATAQASPTRTGNAPMEALDDNPEITEPNRKAKRRPLQKLQQKFDSFRRRRRRARNELELQQVAPTTNIRRRKSSRFSKKSKGLDPASDFATRQTKSINRNPKLFPNNYHNEILFQDRFDTTTGKPFSIFTAVARTQLRTGHIDPDQVPPLLFLEEVAHLLSLMSAVAFSTLRNDLPYAESPLTSFEPGLPWPHVDPDAYKRRDKRGWEGSRLSTLVRFVIGASRTARDRTLYNAARPFRVIGNVSDQEIDQLQQARGPLAKVSLVSMWIQELISREYQTGDTTGCIAPPIISRLYQFISEGMAGYNQARKIASIPFPFAHAQLTTLFLGVVDFLVIPVLMLSFVNDAWLGFVLNVSTVLCFTGLHEVAREIESPFQNVPNDVPLNNFQAQFNEGLMVMFYGFHPDAYWDVDETLEEIQNLQNGGNSSGGSSGNAKMNESDNAKKASNDHNTTPATKIPPATYNATDNQSTVNNIDPEIAESIETVLSNGGKLAIPIQRNEEFATKAEEERDEYDKVGGNTRSLSREQLDLLEAKERQQKLDELQQEQQEAKKESGTSSDGSRHQQQVSFLVPTEDDDSSVVFTASARDSQHRTSGSSWREGQDQASMSSDDFSQEEPTIL